LGPAPDAAFSSLGHTAEGTTGGRTAGVPDSGEVGSWARNRLVGDGGGVCCRNWNWNWNCRCWLSWMMEYGEIGRYEVQDRDEGESWSRFLGGKRWKVDCAGLAKQRCAKLLGAAR
jgi:hypothetical protein